MSTAAPAVADVTAEPKIRAFPLGSYDGKPQRSISYEWLVREDANGDKTVVTLSCGHTRGRYYALVNNERHEPVGVTVSAPFSAERLPSEPCARYSKANFERFAAGSLAYFRERVAEGQFGDFLSGEHAPHR